MVADSRKDGEERMSEEYIIKFPLTEAHADMAGIPLTWLERAVRAVGTPVARSWPEPLPIEFGTLGLEYCECEHPMIRCDHLGCRCQRCGKHQRLEMRNITIATQP